MSSGVSSVLLSKGYVRYIHVNHITHHTHTHTCICTQHTHIRRDTYTHAVHTHTYDAYSHTHTCTHMHMYTCRHTDTHKYMYIHTQACTHTQSLSPSFHLPPALPHYPQLYGPSSPILPMHPSLTSEHVLSNLSTHSLCTVI